jgi:hypothetical protein
VKRRAEDIGARSEREREREREREKERKEKRQRDRETEKEKENGGRLALSVPIVRASPTYRRAASPSGREIIYHGGQHKRHQHQLGGGGRAPMVLRPTRNLPQQTHFCLTEVCVTYLELKIKNGSTQCSDFANGGTHRGANCNNANSTKIE